VECDEHQDNSHGIIIETNMAELRDKEQSTVVEIVADGDVILIVGPEKLKLRVHSLFLKAASRPFSAMFGPDWKEGHSLFGRDGPAELPLPEENGAALKLICVIIHHRNNMVPQTLAAGDVLGIAVTADKYDCIDALKFASGNWLQPRQNKAGDLMLLAAAAYLFQDAPAFQEITKAMILNHGGPYLTLSCEEVESAMNWRVFCEYLNDQLGYSEHVTDWPMYRSARRTTKLCKAEIGRNPISGNKRLDWEVCSQVWMVEQICICLFKLARKTGPLADALALHL